jgi:multiple sugar transport system substrate-binding protein
MFDDAGNVNWSEASIASYLDYLKSLIDSGAAPAADIQEEFGVLSPDQSLMGINRAAFQPQWSNQLNAVANASGANIGLLRFPGEATSNHVGTWLRPSMTFAVASNAQSPAAAICFVDFMVNSPEAAAIMGIDRGIPMNQTIFDQVVPNLTGSNALQADFIDRVSAKPGVSVPVPELTDDLNNVLNVSTMNALFGRATSAEAAASLHTALQGALG